MSAICVISSRFVNAGTAGRGPRPDTVFLYSMAQNPNIFGASNFQLCLTHAMQRRLGTRR